MDQILMPDPNRATVVYEVARPPKPRRLPRILIAIVLVYLGLVVGAPWMLREAPPNVFAVVVTKAECAAPAHAATCAAATAATQRKEN